MTKIVVGKRIKTKNFTINFVNCDFVKHHFQELVASVSEQVRAWLANQQFLSHDTKS